jgi:hypothetical protein
MAMQQRRFVLLKFAVEDHGAVLRYDEVLPPLALLREI